MSALTDAVDTLVGTDPTSLDDTTLGTEILQIELALRRLQGAKADSPLSSPSPTAAPSPAAPADPPPR